MSELQDAGSTSFGLANDQKSLWDKLLNEMGYASVLEAKVIPVSYRVVIIRKNPPEEGFSMSYDDYQALIQEKNLPT